MSENMKGALLACALSLPMVFGVGWVADIVTRASVGAIMISHGDDPAAIIKQSILAQMWPGLIAIWLLASAIVVGLAYIGLGDHRVRFPPPPPLPPNSEPERATE